jgi:hypothetical protein
LAVILKKRFTTEIFDAHKYELDCFRVQARSNMQVSSNLAIKINPGGIGFPGSVIGLN